MKVTSVEAQVPPPIPHRTVVASVTATADATPVIVGGYTIGGTPVTLHQTKGKRVVDVMDPWLSCNYYKVTRVPENEEEKVHHVNLVLSV